MIKIISEKEEKREREFEIGNFGYTQSRCVLTKFPPRRLFLLLLVTEGKRESSRILRPSSRLGQRNDVAVADGRIVRREDGRRKERKASIVPSFS